jgi:hypothetical protein
MPQIVIMRAIGQDCRVLDAVCDGVPLVVTLDSGAAMKLMGNSIGSFEPLCESNSARIAAAAERVIQMERRVPQCIFLTALDLD